MSEKSQKTEEEQMLDQTFGTYDADMTVENDAATVQTEKSVTTTATKKPMNSNVLIGAGVGVAAIALIGFKFMGVHQQPQQEVQPQVQQPVVVANPQPVQPQVAATTQPEAPAQNNNTGNDNSAAAQFLGNNNPLAPKTDKVEDNKAATPVATESPKVEVAVSPTPVTVKTEPVNTTPKVDVTVNPNVVASNASQSGLTNELKSLFDKQTQEIKGAVENVGNRVDKLEQSVAKQESTNKSIEARLSSLESGKAVKVVKVSEDNNNNNNDVQKAKKPVVKHKHVVKKVAKTQSSESDSSLKSSVIIDKKVTTKEVKVESNNYPQLEIYSLYGDRIWTKNKDGSLSTFTVGDSLPSGEVVKKIDDSNYKVTTDKRVIIK